MMKKESNLVEKVLVSWQRKWMEYLVLGMLFIIPLYVGMKNVFPFTTPKSLLIILAGCLLAIFWLHQVAVNKEERSFSFGYIHLFLLIFLVANIVSAVSGIDPSLSFFGSMLDGTGVNLLIALGIFALSVSYLIKKDRNFLDKMLLVSFVTSFLVSIGCYLIKAYPMAAGGSTLGNTSYTGAYLLVNICFGIYLFFLDKNKWHRLFILLGAGFMGFSPIFFDWSVLANAISFRNALHHPLSFVGSAEGAFLGLVVAILVISTIALTRAKKKFWRFAGVSLFILALISMYAVGRILFNPNTSLHKLYVEQKTNNRFLFVDIAREGFMQKPILGWGANNYAYVFNKGFSPLFFDRNYAYEPITNNPHNIFWGYLISGGIVGLLAYLLLIGGTGIILYLKFSQGEFSRDRILSLVALGILVGYVIQNLFIFDTPVTYLMLFLIIGIALSYSNNWSFELAQKYTKAKKIICIALISILGVAIIYVYLKPRAESRVWASYTNIFNILKRDKNTEYISGLGYSQNSAYIADAILNLVSRDKNKLSNQDRYRLIQVINKLAADLGQEIKHDKNNYRALWSEAKLKAFAFQLGEGKDPALIESAIEYFQSALKFNPSDQNIYFDLAEAYLLENNFKQASSYIKAGIAIAPEYAPGYNIANILVKFIPDNKQTILYIENMKNRWNS